MDTSWIKALCSGIALLAATACQSDATDLIRGKRLELKLSQEKVKIGEKVTVGVHSEEPYDSAIIIGVPDENYTRSENGFEVWFESVGQKRLEVKTFANGEEKTGVANLWARAPQPPIERTFEIVETLPHNPEYYTQGLEFKNGKLYESRGQRRESAVYRLSFPQMKVEAENQLPDEQFGEGLTFWGDTLYQLTWRARTANLYDPDLNKITSLPYPLEDGWGICFDGEKLLASDGSNILYSLNKNLELQGRQEVYAGNSPLDDLNELEFVNGKVVANEYKNDRIYFIDPITGVAQAVVDFSALREYLTNPQAEVLNGIAYLPERELFLITGKLWDKAFLVRILPSGNQEPS